MSERHPGLRHHAVALVVLLATLIGGLMFPLGIANAQEERRLAVVIGNSDYKAVGGLPNAAGDSKLIADSLTSLGFDVTHLENASLKEMQSAIGAMAEDAESGDVSATLLYFAGHGFQLGGTNYLVPVDAVLDSRKTVAKRTLALDQIIAQLESEDHETIILLDACRDNPLPESVRSKDDGQGLAMVTTGSNTYIAFATRPGGVTADGKGKHGPFATALAEGMTYPDVPISGMMTKVRHAVWTETNSVQEPWSNDTLHEEFFFNGGDGEAGVTLASTEPVLDSLFDQPATPTLPASDQGDLVVAATEPEPKPEPKPTPKVGPPATDVASLGTATPIESTGAPTEALPRVTEPAVTVKPGTTAQPTIASQPADAGQPSTTAQPTIASQPANAGQPSTTAQPNTQNGAADDVDVASLGGSTAPTLQPLQTNAPAVIGVELPEQETEPVPGADVPGLEPVPEADPVRVASAMQEELHRIGCYSGSVDGDWGKGSRTALRQYFAAKKESVPGTDPTEALLARLSDEDGRVCTAPPKPKVVATPKTPKTTPATTAGGGGSGAPKKVNAAPKVASEPAAQPPKKMNKLAGGTGAFR